MAPNPKLPAPEPQVLAAAGPPQAGLSRAPAIEGRIIWGALPATKDEVESIRRAWADKPTPFVLEGTQAGESGLRAALPGKKYIHMATHGFFADEKYRSLAGHDETAKELFAGPRKQELVTARQAKATVRNPLVLSGIVLAGANLPRKTDGLGLPTGDNGIMTAEEIVGLDLRGTELVVLSACKTGLGRVAGGEGVMGLARAFHLAGARSVVASLWQVDDRATQALMVEFYKNLWEKKLSKLESLRQAQLTMLREYDPKDGRLRSAGAISEVDPEKLTKAKEAGGGHSVSPFYWAAFVLSGDWR